MQRPAETRPAGRKPAYEMSPCGDLCPRATTARKVIAMLTDQKRLMRILKEMHRAKSAAAKFGYLPTGRRIKLLDEHGQPVRPRR